ncbi:ABC transporter, ATP-binding protein [Aphelenchoides fujianensis]|nr:ABC transporter, ATP-binding protein [Aphelenchoides fujianensis]
MSLMAVATYFPEYCEHSCSKCWKTCPTIQSPPVGDHQRAGDWSEVTFDSVDFAYPMNKKSRVLRNFDLHIARGKTIASRWPLRSTVIQLLERFYDPDAGAIRIHEADLKKTDLMTHRSHVALVGQEPILFNYTIEENIAYGLKNVGMERIIEAARQANCHQFITQLPEGYKTIVGEKGSRISGGQKQRIAIARAIVRQPRILLLDEATSALDSESEKIVQEALEKARVGRTSIVIAHRLSTIQTADLIVVVEGGRVVETGTHQSLLALDGKYASLTKQQGL